MSQLSQTPMDLTSVAELDIPRTLYEAMQKEARGGLVSVEVLVPDSLADELEGVLRDSGYTITSTAEGAGRRITITWG